MVLLCEGAVWIASVRVGRTRKERTGRVRHPWRGTIERVWIKLLGMKERGGREKEGGCNAESEGKGANRREESGWSQEEGGRGGTTLPGTDRPRSEKGHR